MNKRTTRIIAWAICIAMVATTLVGAVFFLY